MATKIRDIIAYFSEHEVSEDIRERVLQRIAYTENDKEADNALKDLWDKADRAYMDSEDVEKAFHTFTEKVHCIGRQKKQERRHWTLKVAAVTIPLLLIAILAKMYLLQSNVSRVPLEIAMTQVYTMSNEEKTMLLPDSSNVKLSPSSVLLYPSNFNGLKERKVFLCGEAYFDVKHNDNQPFRLNTPYFDILDLGTSFSVSSYTDKEEVSATLISGKIELRLTENNKIYKMSPKDCLVYNVRTKQCHIDKLENFEQENWKTAQINLNDISLSEAAMTLEKAYNIKVHFLTNNHKQTKITAHFNRGETLQRVMDVIADLIPGLEYQINNKTVTIK